MHICFLTNEYPKEGFPHGGVGTFVRILGKNLVKNGVNVSVVGLNYTNEYEEAVDEGIHIYRTSFKKTKGLQWYNNNKSISNKIREIHSKQPIDIVEVSELGLAFLQKIKGIKYIIRMHGGHHYFAKAENRNVEFWKAFQEKRSFSRADYVLAVSNYVAETTKELLNLNNLSVKVIYNPIDSKKFYQSRCDKINKQTIFFAGSLVEKKGIRQLIKAMPYIIKEYPNTHLYIAGRDANIPGTNKPYRPIIEKEISEEIRSNITFLGVVSNESIMQYIERSEVCCYPSHMEAMPLAWLEVLAMGKAFVGSTTGPGKEAVNDGVTGWLVNPFNSVDIANKIIEVFNDPNQAKIVGENARLETIKKFDISIIAKQNIDFYNKIKNR